MTDLTEECDCEDGVSIIHCQACGGSGEGRGDGSTCSTCDGDGEIYEVCSCGKGVEIEGDY